MSTMTAWTKYWGELEDVFEFSTPVDLGAAIVGGLIAIAVVFATDWARQPIVNHLGFTRRSLPIGTFYYLSSPLWMRLVAALIVIVAATLLSAIPNSLGSSTRACGFVSYGIGTSVRATPNVSCRTARRVINAEVHSSCAWGQTCTFLSYRCRTPRPKGNTVIRTRCVRGNRMITGVSGP